MASNLTNEEKKRLSNERQNAVRNAWREERERVKCGQGTRDWSPSEQKELIQRGAVSGYEGHHMKSVSLYPEYAGDSENIQFLSEEEHLQGAHQGSYHNATNGYYDPETQTMNEFEGDELKAVPVNNLSEGYSVDCSEDISQAREEYMKDNTYSDLNSESDDLQNAIATYENDFNSTDSESEGSSESVCESNGIGR